MDKIKLVVCDVDDVIVNTSIKWVAKALAEDPIFNRVENPNPIYAAFANDKEAFDKLVMGRDEYYLNKWLGLPNVAFNYFMEVYLNDGRFYDDLTPTTLAMNFVAHSDTNKYIFVTHCGGGVCDLSKKNLIDRVFKNTNYTYEAVPMGVPKSEVIALKYSNFDVFIDDDPRNHIDVMQNCGKEGQEYLFPLYGYNANLPFLAEQMIIDKKLTLNAY